MFYVSSRSRQKSIGNSFKCSILTTVYFQTRFMYVNTSSMQYERDSVWNIVKVYKTTIQFHKVFRIIFYLRINRYRRFGDVFSLTHEILHLLPPSLSYNPLKFFIKILD